MESSAVPRCSGLVACAGFELVPMVQQLVQVALRPERYCNELLILRGLIYNYLYNLVN
jgi:hypothetical protein